MTVYSPFQSQLHLECPLKRILAAKERWVPRQIEQRDISAILGVAVAKGLEVFNKGGGDAAARAAAFTHATELQRDALLVGRVLPSHHESQWSNVAPRAEAALAAYAGVEFPFRIVDVEMPYGPEGGHARPDLIVDDGRSPRVPFDYKVTLSLGRTKSDAVKNRERRIARWAHSFQLMMYARLEEVFHFYIGFMVLEPEFSFETIPFEIHPETMEMWLAGAQETWRDMAAVDGDERAPQMSASHADEFGECMYKRACFEHHLDPALMAQDYVQVAR